MSRMSRFNTKVLLTITVFACIILSGYSSDLPADIHKCKSTDNEECIGQTIMEIFKRYPKGNSEFGLLDVSALTLNNITVSKSNPNSPIQLDFKFLSFTASGMEKTKVLRTTGFDKEFKRIVEVEALIPSLKIQGNYESQGKLLLLPINGHGKGDVLLKEAFANIRSKVQLEKRNDKTYLKIKKMKVTLEPKQMIVNMENIFNDNPVLSDSINSVINENWHDVWTELQMGINKAIEDILIKLCSDIFAELPLENFYID